MKSFHLQINMEEESNFKRKVLDLTSLDGLAAKLRKKLPDYICPKHGVADQIPVPLNGKPIEVYFYE
jgi:hypothetical protein